jgi:hypothetical protein
MPVNLPDSGKPPEAPKGSPFPLMADILDGLAVAFCILLFIWGMQHVVFDYLANPNLPAMLSAT